MSTFEESDPSQGDQGPFDILAVDDDPAIREMLGAVFQYEDYAVKIVSSVSEAKAHIGNAAIVLSDLEMPVEGGDAVAAHMHAAQEDGNDPGDLILMTANSSRASRLRAGEDDLGHPLVAILDKPFSLNTLLTVIDERLKLRRQRQDTEA